MRASLSCEEVSFKQINALQIAMGLFPSSLWFTLGLLSRWSGTECPKRVSIIVWRLGGLGLIFDAEYGCCKNICAVRKIGI